MKNNTNTNYHMAELLAPAGSPEGFYGAINGGADAVYLAGNRFGARAYAENFTTEKLVECIRYAHLHGRKVYLTVNTLFKEAELAELYDYLLPFYEAGLDAVIVQDLGVLRYIRECFPGLEIHVSTQMTLCNGSGAALLKKMGASRVVPARELSLQELISMKEQADVEIEAFIHGAMCYCYSGQCLFSSILGGRSGNRGRCAQPCRLPYTVKAGNSLKENCYPLSLKDMCTIEYVPQLIEAGIDSFKIEGRMKKPEYAAGVTDIYRRAIDSYYALRARKGIEEAIACYKVPKNDMRALRSLYIRSDIQDGYYFKHNGAEMVTMTNPAYSGSSEELLEGIRRKFLGAPLKLPLTVMAEFKTGQTANVTLLQGDYAVNVTGELVVPAQKQPISEENIRKQLNKLGDSAFYAEDMVVSVSEDAFYPLKQINELRRLAVEKLEQQILEHRGDCASAENAYQKNGPKAATSEWDVKEGNLSVRMHQNREANQGGQANQLGQANQRCGHVISISTPEQLMALSEWLNRNAHHTMAESLLRIYVDGDILLQEWEKAAVVCSKISQAAEVWIMLPYILRNSKEKNIGILCDRQRENQWIKGFVVRSMDELGFLQEKSDAPCRGDAGLYTWNQCALEELSAMVEGFCLPYELKASEQRILLGRYPFEKIVYGRIPMMITANCLLRTTDKCKKNSDDNVVLTDRYHKDFKVVRNCRYCYNVIYNSVPLSLHQEIDKWKDSVDLRIDFTYESKAQMFKILDSFMDNRGYVAEYTTGHEKRGVE